MRQRGFHGIWEQNEEEACRRAMAVAKTGYRAWVGMYVVALCLSIGFPIFAIIFDDNIWAKLFAGSAAIAASLNAAFRPGEKATTYDKAVQRLWAARVSYVNDKDAQALVGEIKRALSLMEMTYADGEEGKPLGGAH